MTATLDTKTAESESKAKRKLPKPSLPQWSRKRWAAVGGAGVVVLGSLGAAGTSLFLWHQEATLADSFNAAEAAACKYAPNLGNYDGQNLDPFFTSIINGATGEAKTRFQSTEKFKELRDALKQAKATSIVDDAQCGARGGTKDQVDVVVVMSARSGSLGTQGQMIPKQIGLVATMNNVDGKWLCSKLDAPFLGQ